MKAYFISIPLGTIAVLFFVLMGEMIRQDQLQYSLGFCMIAVVFTIGFFLFFGDHDIVLRKKDVETTE